MQTSFCACAARHTGCLHASGESWALPRALFSDRVSSIAIPISSIGLNCETSDGDALTSQNLLSGITSTASPPTSLHACRRGGPRDPPLVPSGGRPVGTLLCPFAHASSAAVRATATAYARHSSTWPRVSFGRPSPFVCTTAEMAFRHATRAASLSTGAPSTLEYLSEHRTSAPARLFAARAAATARAIAALSPSSSATSARERQ
jgi:hypothetical protein